MGKLLPKDWRKVALASLLEVFIKLVLYNCHWIWPDNKYQQCMFVYPAHCSWGSIGVLYLSLPRALKLKILFVWGGGEPLLKLRGISERN